MTISSRWLAILALVGLSLSCGAAKRRDEDVAKLITNTCTLHSGGAEGKRDASGQTVTSCNYGAECIAHPGTATAGDGFVGLKCADRSCSCEWTSANDQRTIRSAFATDEPCDDTDEAKRIFLARCMPGLRLHPENGD